MSVALVIRKILPLVVLVGLAAVGLSGCVLVPAGYATGYATPAPGYVTPPPAYAAPALVYVAPAPVYVWGNWWWRRHWRYPDYPHYGPYGP